jgi:hypothetical protein
MAPAGSPIRKTGKVVAACTRATIVGVGAREVISHAAPTFCIQVPMLDATDANQSARNNGWRRGLQAVAGIGGIEGWTSAVIFDILEFIREDSGFSFSLISLLKSADAVDKSDLG